MRRIQKRSAAVPLSTRRRAVAVTAAMGLLAAALPAAEAGADSPPPFVGPSLPSFPGHDTKPLALGPLPGSITMPSGLTFTPPAVGQIIVSIGPTIIGGKVINPGLKVTKPALTVPLAAGTPAPPAGA